MNKEVLIIGAGKIGRGFIGQLFYRSGYKLWFVDASKEIVDLLRKEKKYRVDIARESNDLTEYIEVESAYTLEETNMIAAVLDHVDIVVSCVGAMNIGKIAEFMKKLLQEKDKNKDLNWFICENASNPAKKIRDILLKNTYPDFEKFVTNRLGLIETQVLRTGMLAKEEIIAKEPLALRMQDWWTLPYDKDAYKGSLPDVKGLIPKSNFTNELVRKVYSFNGTNGPISYIGWANGFKILHEAALAYRSFFHEIQEEAAFGLVHEYHFDEKEQKEFMMLAMKKYTDPALNDQIERNARDTKRKLSREERLIGPALLCLRHGKIPYAYAKAIAAAYNYDGSNDEGTKEVLNAVRQKGIEEAVKKYSSIDESSELYALVIKSYNEKSFLF